MSRICRLALPLVALVCFVALSAGGSVQPAAAEEHQVNVILRNNRIEPEVVEVPAGEEVVVTVVNQDEAIHIFEIKRLVRETEVFPGETKEFRFTPKRAGTYKMYCETHGDAGMVAQFIAR